MKCATAALVLLSLGAAPGSSNAVRLVVTPMEKVVNLIKELQTKIENDGDMEQQSYDKYACWCEETLKRKSLNMNEAKESIEELQVSMKELKSEIASHGAEIKQLNSDIKDNVASTSEANEIRNKETSEYSQERTESEQCIGALEAAVTVLAGAVGNKGFLETMKEAQLLSVVAGVRSVLKAPAVSRTVKDEDMKVLNRFVSQPQDFMGGRAVSAAQISNNPFGDYAPQSTQIQGILKGMYETFVGDLEKANAEEADAQKAHEQLIETKTMELKTLKKTLETQTSATADKSKSYADDKRLRDDTQDQLKADEAFFADTKQACRTKATEWSERSRLRTEELQGIITAIRILDSTEAKNTFENATTTLMQVARDSRNRGKAYERLANIARQFKSVSLAKVAVQVKTGGHFDKVIISIDAMIQVLRKEDQSDIQHRDRCEGSLNKNRNDLEDLNSDVLKVEAIQQRQTTKEGKLNQAISDLGTTISDTEDEMEQALDLRNQQVAEFKQAMEDDADAVVLLERAIVSLQRFYKNNPVSLRQKREPEYTEDPDKAPETSWTGSNYGGQKSQHDGIVAIISMLKEDLEKEMDVAKAEDAISQENYKKGEAAMQKIVDTTTASKVATEQDLAELQEKIVDADALHTQKTGDVTAEEGLETSLGADCDWIGTHFVSRRDKRKIEMDGLVEAKGYLAGMESSE